MSNALMLLKVLTMSLSIFKLHFNEQRYHLEPYWAQSIATLLLMTGNASIIVHIVENWNALIILQVILDFLCFTTNVTPSVRPSQHIIHVYIYWCASSIFLDNNYSHTTSWQESLEKLLWYTTSMGYWVVWAIFNKLFECNKHVYILIQNDVYYLEVRLPHHIRSYFWWGGGGIEIEQLRSGG